MVTITYAYFMPCVLLLFFLFLIRLNHLFSQEQNRLFTIAAVINLILIVVTSGDYLISLQGESSLWLIRRVTSFLSFACGPLIPIILISIFSEKKISKILYIPFAINMFACFISMFVALVFYIAPDNTYERGPLSFLPIVTFFLYIAYLPLISPKEHSTSKRSELLVIAVMMLVMLVTVILEVVFRFHFLSYSASAVGFVVYYILKNINYFSKDPLTHCFNRQMFDFVFRRQINSQKAAFVVLLDINDFKSINDEKGHEAGDQALILFAESLRKAIGQSADLYRTGGDEFMLLAPEDRKDEVLASLAKANPELQAKHALSFAFGYTTHDPSDDPQETLRLIDNRMYEDKAQAKGLLSRRVSDSVSSETHELA